MNVKYIIAIILIILVIRLIYIISQKIQHIEDKKIDKIYTKINGNDHNNEKYFIQYNEAIRKKGKRSTPLDYYRIGSLYDYVRGNSELAGFFYILSLQKLMEKSVKQKLTTKDNYIIQKMKDRLRLNNTYRALIAQMNIIEEVPLPNHQVNEIAARLDNIDIVVNQNEYNNVDTHQPDEKWVSDSQNVHDSNINRDIANQFSLVKSKTLQSQWDINSIIRYIQRPEFLDTFLERENINNSVSVLRYIEKHNPHIGILGESEANYVGTIFTYIMQEQNEIRKQAMLENFVNNLNDINPNGTPVCINGRITRVISSLATPGIEDAGGEVSEFDKDIGVLKSGQVIRNEILARAGAMRNKVLEDAPENIVNEYNSGEQTENTNNLINQIVDRIDEVLTEYKDAKGVDLQSVRSEIIDNL
jgi:hypothetical protein